MWIQKDYGSKNMDPKKYGLHILGLKKGCPEIYD